MNRALPELKTYTRNQMMMGIARVTLNSYLHCPALSSLNSSSVTFQSTLRLIANHSACQWLWGEKRLEILAPAFISLFTPSLAIAQWQGRNHCSCSEHWKNPLFQNQNFHGKKCWSGSARCVTQNQLYYT